MRFTVYSNDWFLEKLDNVCQFVRDGTHGSFKDVEIGIPLLSAKDIFDGKININENSRLISIDDYNTIHKNYELTKGDILLTIVGTIGRTAMVNMDEKFTLQRSVAILRVNEQISYNFLYYYIQTSAFQNRLKSVVNQSAQGGVYLNSLKKLNIKLTADMNEQNKISSFLSIIDKKIELLEQKYQYYQEFKKYLMQQIFTQKLRFNFDDEWKQYKLKDVLTVKSSSISINQLEENTGDYPLYGASGFLKNIDFCEMDVNYISIVKDGSGVGNLSFHEKNSSIVNTSQYLLPKKNFNINFLYYLLQTINLMKYVNGSSIPHIYFKDYCIEKINIPSLDEQEKIGKLFVDVDITMENLNKNINATQEFKKGLLQQMFVVQLILSLLQNKKHI